MTHYTSHNENDTIALAKELSARAKQGDFFALSGTLGAGKSVFARGFIQSLCGHDINVPSPTFTLVQHYDGGSGGDGDSNKTPIAHFDLYRITVPEELYELGWDEALQDSIMLVEWAENAQHLLPARYHEISFKIAPDERRVIEIIDHDKN